MRRLCFAGLLCAYTMFLRAKFCKVFESRRVMPIRGIIDAAFDGEMIILGDHAAVFLSHAPNVNANEQVKRDFNHFCRMFVTMCKEDEVDPIFNVPIQHGRCASIRVDESMHMSSLVSPSVPVFDAMYGDMPSPYTLHISTRGVIRQVAEGICPDSPLSFAFGRKKADVSALAWNGDMLNGVSHHVHHPANPWGYVVSYLLTHDFSYVYIGFVTIVSIGTCFGNVARLAYYPLHACLAASNATLYTMRRG